MDSDLVERLASAGCVAPEDEVVELLEAAGGQGDVLEAMVRRRLEGVPLAWITGSARFLGERILVSAGVYVPRYQTEILVEAALRRLPRQGVAADLCTGSGAIAAVLSRRRPGATVVASDIDPVAVACARANGVEAFCGNLDAPLPDEVVGRGDLLTAVVPYVPSAEMAYLPRDVRVYEPAGALDGGPDGCRYLRLAVEASSRILRPGGWCLLELGGDQDEVMAVELARSGFGSISRLVDEDGDLRALEARFG